MLYVALNMVSRSILFPVFVRLISRSCIREKISSNKNVLVKLDNTQSLPVEKDTEKLAKYLCGSNLFIEEGQDVKLKEDSEYPDWLWKIRSPPPLEELSPNTKTYWNRIRKMRVREKMHLLSFQKSKTVHK